MLDLTRLNRIDLSPEPLSQKVVAHLLLRPNYGRSPGVSISFENYDNVPAGENVIYAMNHTDRYNYWPMQYHLWHAHDRFTATWVKGKYNENAMLGRFLEWTNNIPTVSRGYIIARDFLATIGERPSTQVYDTLRRWVDNSVPGNLEGVPDNLLTLRRDILLFKF